MAGTCHDLDRMAGLEVGGSPSVQLEHIHIVGSHDQQRRTAHCCEYIKG